MSLPLLRRDVLLLQLTHVRKTRALADLLHELLHRFCGALGFAFDLFSW